jgi:hypothetical protein
MFITVLTSLTPVSILGQKNPVHILLAYLSDIPFSIILSSTSRSRSLPLRFSYKNVTTISYLSCVVTCPNSYHQCEISSSHSGEYDVQSCLLGYTAV